MRLFALPLALALCIVVFACKGREQVPPDTAASVPVPPPANSATTPQSNAGAVSTPVDTSVPKSTQKVTRPPDTSRAAPQKTGTQQTDTAKSDTTKRKFKKPEIRPNYPPIDRRRTDTTTRRDTTGDR